MRLEPRLARLTDGRRAARARLRPSLGRRQAALELELSTSASASARPAAPRRPSTGRPSSPRERREGRVLEPAGRDPLRERRRVEVDVERVAVRRHPVRDVDADRRDLPRRPRQPDAGQALDSLAFDAELRQRQDQRLLEVAAVALDVLAVPLQVEDRVADELPGPVVGRLAAAVGLDDVDLGAGRDVQLRSSVRRPIVTVGGCSSSRIVSGIAPGDRRGERALQLPGLLVRDDGRGSCRYAPVTRRSGSRARAASRSSARTSISYAPPKFSPNCVARCSDSIPADSSRPRIIIASARSDDGRGR